MKKIGILTFHRTTNFGSMLQTYATYKAIELVGGDCEIIDYRCDALEKRENMNPHVFTLNIKELLRNIIILPRYREKTRYLLKFCMTKMEMSQPYYRDTIEQATQYDKYIVGSDIVWGRDITENDYTYFLDFITTKGKYAFSSSVGTHEICGDEKHVALLLSDFDKIAVRENDTISWLDTIGITGGLWVCDPTMLLTPEQWCEFIKPKHYKEKYVLVYFLSPNDKNLCDAIEYGKKHNCRVYLIKYSKPIKGVKVIKPSTLEEFLGLIYNAEMIFTASYHGMLFSIYFNKEFLFYTRAHKNRVLSLADRLELMNQCGDSINVDDYKKINYNLVNERVSEFRNYSMEILKDIIDE